MACDQLFVLRHTLPIKYEIILTRNLDKTIQWFCSSSGNVLLLFLVIVEKM